MSDDVLRQMVDRQAITDGLHWYTRWVDLNRVDKQVEIFTEDGCIAFRGDESMVQGRDNIEALIAPLVAAYEATPPPTRSPSTSPSTASSPSRPARAPPSAGTTCSCRT